MTSTIPLAKALAFVERQVRESRSKSGPAGIMVDIVSLAEVMAIIEDCDMRLRRPGGSGTFTLRRTDVRVGGLIGRRIMRIAKAMRKARREELRRGNES